MISTAPQNTTSENCIAGPRPTADDLLLFFFFVVTVDLHTLLLLFSDCGASGSWTVDDAADMQRNSHHFFEEKYDKVFFIHDTSGLVRLGELRRLNGELV